MEEKTPEEHLSFLTKEFRDDLSHFVATWPSYGSEEEALMAYNKIGKESLAALYETLKSIKD